MIRKFLELIFGGIGNNPNVKDLSVAEFFESYKADKMAVLLDVRTPKETAAGMIKGAKVINILGGGFSSEIEKLDKSKSYYIYCRSGKRSMNACNIMQNMGFENTANLKGGYIAYNNQKS